MTELSQASLKKWTSDKKLVIGTERSIKLLKQGKLAKVFLTSNAPESIKRDFSRNANASSTELIQLDINNEQLGNTLKKPFLVSVIGVLK